ncbi:MAG TPA: DNA/RNA nuclease SfsA [Bacteroidetes bacterium]|nr:DNA/RNA nuclease SfsA [Bacteroidota bacterium]
MKFEKNLIKGKLIKRYKRFLADIQLEDSHVITAHCPNSGSMMGLLDEGNDVYVWQSDNPKRKLKYSWELVQSNGTLVGINTMRPNYLVKEAIEAGVIAELQGYPSLKMEVKYGQKSRLDMLLENSRKCYVEVKNVTLVKGDIALFPDSVTSRGAKHLDELLHIIREGNRAVVVFVVQREDAVKFVPAIKIDPVFSGKLKDVLSEGVEALAYQAVVSKTEIKIVRKLPVSV